MVDPDQTKLHIQRNRINFDVHNVPRQRFLVGGTAWQACRSGEKDAARFGVAPQDFFSGWWALRNRVVHELAFQNKVELLLWDSWDWMEYDYEPDTQALAVLDQVAALTQRGDQAFSEIQKCYRENSHLKAPTEIMSYSPTGEFRKVSLAL